MLKPDVAEEIRTLVRTGAYDNARLAEIFCEELYEPGELDPNVVSAAIERETAVWNAEKQGWPDVTDCDRLDTAFAALNERGVLAIQNAGNTQDDGYQMFRDTLERHPTRESIVGYCFYHGQDLERAVRGGGLFLAFGPVNALEEETKGSKIGQIVRDELERAGLGVAWDGTFSQRIHVPRLVWQRR